MYQSVIIMRIGQSAGKTLREQLGMQNHIEETESGIYRITSNGDVFCQSKHKIPVVSKGMVFTGEFLVRLKPERKMKYALNNRGYYSVGIQKTTHMVHRLVAQAFIPNPENKPFVNHIDGNKLNNSSYNLEWCTCAENNAHARKNGLHVQAKGHKIAYKSHETKAASLANLKSNRTLSDDDVRYIRKVHIKRSKEFSATALSAKFGISVAAMCLVIKRKTYTHVK